MNAPWREAWKKKKPPTLPRRRNREKRRKQVQMNYNTDKTNRTRFWLIVLLAAVILGGIVFKLACDANAEEAEDQLVTCWVMCQPGDYVNVRRTPGKRAAEVGRLESGDAFQTDGTSSDGWIRCYGIGEYGEGWIYCGYVVTEEPVTVFQRYVCVSNGRVACRRWMGGPQTRNPWIRNGSNVDVFLMADGWAVTSRGYIRSEYLEADPE